MSRAALLQELDRVTSKDVGAVITAFQDGSPPREEILEVVSYCRGILASWDRFAAALAAVSPEAAGSEPPRPVAAPSPTPTPEGPPVVPEAAAAVPGPADGSPGRDGLSIVTAEYQPVESTEAWTRYAVRVRVANASSEHREFRVGVRFFNAAGFMVDSRSFAGSVGPLDGTQIDGDKMISGPPSVVAVAAVVEP